MLIRFFAGAAEAAGMDQLDMDAEGLTVEALVARLGADNERLARVLEVSSLLVDGERRTSGALESAAQVDVLPPFAGG